MPDDQDFEPHPLTPARRTVVFALVGAGHTMSHVFILTLPPLFALIKGDLDINYAALGLMVTMFHVATGAMQIPAGILVDRLGARVTLTGGMILSAACMGAIGAADSYWLMVVLAALAGVGNSVFHPADYAILAAAVHKRHVGKAFSFHLLTGNLGFAAAPVIMVTLAALWDWRIAVMTVGGAGMAVAATMILFGRDLHATPAPAAGEGESAGATGTRALFSPALLAMLAFFITVAVANSGLQSFSVTLLNTEYGVDLGAANTALTLYLSAGFVGIAIGGIVADRLNHPVVLVVVTMLITAAGIAALTVRGVPWPVVLIAMALAGGAMGMMRPPRDMMVNAVAPPGSTGKAFGFMGTGLSVGGAVAPVAIGAMIDAGAASWVFAICVGFILAGAGTAILAECLGRSGPVVDSSTPASRARPGVSG